MLQITVNEGVLQETPQYVDIVIISQYTPHIDRPYIYAYTNKCGLCHSELLTWRYAHDG